MDEQKIKKEMMIGKIYFVLFVLLILGGIIVKRVYGHPEFMMVFHLPAAVFLVLAGMKLSTHNRIKYLQQIADKKVS